MTIMTANQLEYEVSKINFLHFIIGTPSDYNTLYTSLTHAKEIVSMQVHSYASAIRGQIITQ